MKYVNQKNAGGTAHRQCWNRILIHTKSDREKRDKRIPVVQHENETRVSIVPSFSLSEMQNSDFNRVRASDTVNTKATRIGNISRDLHICSGTRT